MLSQHQQGSSVDSLLVIFQGSHQISTPGSPGQIFCCAALQIFCCRPPPESSSQPVDSSASRSAAHPGPSLAGRRRSGFLLTVSRLICFSAEVSLIKRSAWPLSQLLCPLPLSVSILLQLISSISWWICLSV